MRPFTTNEQLERRREQKHQKQKSERPPGRRSYLTKARVKQLENNRGEVPMLMGAAKITKRWRKRV